MSFERFVAVRYLRAKRRIGLISILSYISIAGISIGVAALVVVLSVFNGFNSFAVEQLVGFDPHIRIVPESGSVMEADSLIRQLDVQQFQSVAPFISGRSAITHESVVRVAEIRGVDISSMLPHLSPSVRQGLSKPPTDGSVPLVMGSLMAAHFGVGLGSRVSIVSRQGLELALSQVAQPVEMSASVTGTFSLNQEYDERVAFTSLDAARTIFDLPQGEMGVEIRLDDFRQAEAVSAEIAPHIGSGYRIETWQDLHKDLYGAMQLERWAAFVILMLIVIVAVFNVLGSLTMTVIEKRRDIGALKSMGASDHGIMRVFLYDGIIIGVIGTGVGLVLGLVVCILQQEFAFVALDTTSYLLPAIPVRIEVIDCLLVCVCALTLALLASVYPARRAARILPADAVRWE